MLKKEMHAGTGSEKEVVAIRRDMWYPVRLDLFLITSKTSSMTLRHAKGSILGVENQHYAASGNQI